MIKENQRTLNSINVLLVVLLLFIDMPVSFYIRFYILHNGIITVPLSTHMLLLFLISSHLVTFATMGLYEFLRKRTLSWELTWVFWGSVIDFILAQTGFFLYNEVHFSQGVLFRFFGLAFCGMCAKRVCLRLILRHYRQQGFNQKHVLLVGTAIWYNGMPM